MIEVNELHAYREALKNSIVTAGLGLEAADIVIARQADLFTQIENTVSRASNGVCLVISAVNGKNLYPDNSGVLVMGVDLKLTLWVLPIYNTYSKTEEEIFIPLMRHLHGLSLIDVPLCSMALKVMNFHEVPDPDYLVREMTCRQELVIKG